MAAQVFCVSRFCASCATIRWPSGRQAWVTVHHTRSKDNRTGSRGFMLHADRLDRGVVVSNQPENPSVDSVASVESGGIVLCRILISMRRGTKKKGLAQEKVGFAHPSHTEERVSHIGVFVSAPPGSTDCTPTHTHTHPHTHTHTHPHAVD
jgi:hypothetical protein